MRRVTDDDFAGLVALVREHQAGAIEDSRQCASGDECPSCFAVRMRFAAVAAYVVATQDELGHAADSGDVPFTVDGRPDGP